MLTDEQVSGLKKGDTIYNNAIWATKPDGTIVPYKAKIVALPRKNAKDQTILIKRLYGNHGEGKISVEGRKLWRISLEKGPEDENVLPAEVSRPTARRVVVDPPTAKEARKPVTTKQQEVAPVKAETSGSMRIRRPPRPSKLSEAEAADLFNKIGEYFS
jgi:hypothetical protein